MSDSFGGSPDTVPVSGKPADSLCAGEPSAGEAPGSVLGLAAPLSEKNERISDAPAL